MFKKSFKSKLIIFSIFVIALSCIPVCAFKDLTIQKKVKVSSDETVKVYDMRQYMVDTGKIIRINWHPPVTSKNCSSTVVISIDKNGNLVNSYMPIASTNASFNRSLVQAVKTSVYKPLPEGFPNETIELRYTFSSINSTKVMKPVMSSLSF